MIVKFFKDAYCDISQYAIPCGNSHTDNVKILTNAEIIFDDFRSKDTLPLNNRGQTSVSLSGFLEILSKTELSSDKIDQRASRTLLLKENPIDTIPNETQNCVSSNLLYLTQ